MILVNNENIYFTFSLLTFLSVEELKENTRERLKLCNGKKDIVCYFVATLIMQCDALENTGKSYEKIN